MAPNGALGAWLRKECLVSLTVVSTPSAYNSVCFLNHGFVFRLAVVDGFGEMFPQLDRFHTVITD